VLVAVEAVPVVEEAELVAAEVLEQHLAVKVARVCLLTRS